MPVLDNKFPTLVDVANMPDMGDAGEIVNMLAQFNPILEDAPAYPCNKGTYHETTIRTGLPTPVWGRLYKGVPQSKGQRQQIKDTTGFLEALSSVDSRLIDVVEKAEEKASLRLEEAEGHMEAMAQEMASGLFYHDLSVDPEKFMGLAPRFSLTTAENGGQIIDGGGVGADNTSIWDITWEKKACHLLYPKGYRAGIQREDKGQQRVVDGNGNPYYIVEEMFTWHIGLVVRDWRYVTRVANIDVSDLTVDASAGADLIERMTQAYYKNYGRRLATGRSYIYANTNIVKFLDFQSRNAVKNLFLTFKEAGPNAEEVLHFRGKPIRETDAILDTEAVVA